MKQRIQVAISNSIIGFLLQLLNILQTIYLLFYKLFIYNYVNRNIPIEKC
jgi:hypothetical protein